MLNIGPLNKMPPFQSCYILRVIYDYGKIKLYIMSVIGDFLNTSVEVMRFYFPSILFFLGWVNVFP